MIREVHSKLTAGRFLVVLVALVAAGFADGPALLAATADEGRIQIPSGNAAGPAAPGLQKLGGGNGLLYIPSSYRPGHPLPLLILLHKSQGNPLEWFSGGRLDAADSYSHYADAGGFAILAPKASSNTWDGGPKAWGHDYVAINRALEAAFSRVAIDRNRLAIGGFSDGGSYALSLGLANGDLFRNVIAFSPGYITRSVGRGKPSLFISHGTFDNILPIDQASRAFVKSLRKNGYSVDYHEFGGWHTVPPPVAAQAMARLTDSFRSKR